MKIISLYHKKYKKRLLEFIINHPKSTPFHEPDWIKHLCKKLNIRDHSIGIVKKSEVVAWLPLMGIKSIFHGYNLISSPLSRYTPFIYNDSEAAALLLNRALEICKYLNYDRFILRAQPLNKQITKDSLIEKVWFNNHILKISNDFESVKSKFHKNAVLRSINRANKENVKIKKISGKEADELFNSIEIKARKHQGSITMPKGFISMMEQSFGKKRCCVTISCIKQQPISIEVIVNNKNTAFAFFNASIPGKHLRKKPNNLLIFDAIKRASLKGYSTFDFGPAHIMNTGLNDFKSQWGTERSPVCDYYYLNNCLIPSMDLNSFKYKLLKKAIKYMPEYLYKNVCKYLIYDVL